MSLPPVEPETHVVDIRRFSTHDGTGIRTTIFLKGCTLACAWCQNPESMSGGIRPVFFESRCIHCGLCVDAATAGEAKWKTPDSVTVDTTIVGADWEAQARRCPTKAITFDGQVRGVEELVDLALRDRVFYRDGGGVTISGGEPLFWPHFTLRLLERLQEEDIHTAIETALNVRQRWVAEMLPFTDLIYADCKLIDTDAHRKWTGHGNERILDNLRFLLTSVKSHSVIVRTPLIPGITATEENISGIGGFLASVQPKVKWELLNYNPLAAAKYEHVDRDFVFGAEENPRRFTHAEMHGFREIARDAGVEHIVTE